MKRVSFNETVTVQYCEKTEYTDIIGDPRDPYGPNPSYLTLGLERKQRLSNFRIRFIVRKYFQAWCQLKKNACLTQMIVVIDGNIGSGKSTQVEKLKDDYSIHREPLEKWGNLLKWFYADAKRWALTFQMRVIKCFNEVTDDTSDVLVVERYPESSRCVFWKSLCNDKIVTPEEQDIYRDYYETFVPDVLIFLRCPPEECVKRFRERGQSGDDQITMEYMEQLHNLYDDMYKEKPNAYILDGTLDPEEINKRIKDIICINK